jgi:hypothetical protein
MQLILDRHVAPLIRAGENFLLGRMVRSYEPYHPVYVKGRQLSAGERSCLDRWTAVESHLQKLKPASLLDLGCAEGYFVQQAASKLSCLALGIDADERRLTVARMTTSLNGLHGAGFIKANLTPPFIDRLPPFDVTVFLSVMHHIMYEHGVDYSRQIMVAIRKVTRQCLIFDMGQSNEAHHPWAKLLPEMLPSPSEWTKEFLMSAGFGSVELIGETDSYKSDVRRHLFIARP